MSEWKIEEFDNATLRDKFAMSALTGLMANADWFRYEEDNVAERCYAIASAMLKAREGKE